jgi:hypothetical protein
MQENGKSYVFWFLQSVSMEVLRSNTACGGEFGESAEIV